MNKFMLPEIEITNFDVDDVITTSVFVEPTSGGDDLGFG